MRIIRLDMSKGRVITLHSTTKDPRNPSYKVIRIELLQLRLKARTSFLGRFLVLFTMYSEQED